MSSSAFSALTVLSDGSYPSGFVDLGEGVIVITGEWEATPIGIQWGGTGATDAPDALTNLGALPIAGGTMTGNLILNADPTNALGAVTKQYADAISAGLTFKDSCYAASTANLNSTYLNGVSGVGATLTNAGSLAAFSIDGVSPTANSRILVKNQTTTFQNGIYSLTTVGSGSVAWILTRTSDYDTVSEIAPGDFVLIENGTVNTNTSWIQTATVTTIGTSAITFSQFGNPGTVTSVSGTAGQIDVANGTSTPVISIDAAYVGQTSITTLGTISTGTWNGSVIPLAYGGTNANLTASNGGIFYSTASAGAILAGTATANQVLLSGSSTTPAWSTATYPATTTINQLLYSSSANVIAGLATANNGVLITSSGGVPSISSTLPTAVQTNITELGKITVGTWAADIITIPYGGTGNTTFTAYSVICAGTTATGAFQNVSGLGTSGQVLTSAGAGALPTWQTAASGSVTSVGSGLGLTGGPITTTGTLVLDLTVVTQRAYCVVATTANLSATYSNGSSGVGATLTNNSTQVAISIDGVSLSSGNRVLVKNQSTTYQNGIYTVTTVGSGSTNWVLTRATDFDGSITGSIAQGVTVWISQGTVNTETLWMETGAGPFTVGTTAITFSGYPGQSSITTLGTISTGTWNGSLIPLAYGGTNANLTASNGGIFYSTSSAGAILAGTATANQILLSGASGAPSWSTVTHPATTTINQLLYSSSANVIAGLATANNGVLITSSGGVPSISSTLPTAVQTNITELGTITVGTWTGTTIAVANGGTGNTTFTAYSVLCAGTTATGAFQNVSGLGSSGQVLTSNGASALPTWQDPTIGVIVNQNTSSVTMVAGSQYYINNGSSLVTLTLPSTAAQGDTFIIVGGSSGGWKVAQNASQQINLNSTATTSGTGGSLASTNQYNCLTIKCITANTTFVAFDSSGSLTVV